MAKVKVIAEIANAHLGDPARLAELIIAAADSGADAVKFQWFRYDSIAAPDFIYYQDYIDLSIDKKIWADSLKLAKGLGLEVWVDIYDEWGVGVLAEFENFVDGLKVPTTVLQSNTLIQALKKFEKPILIGVGGWFEEEIDKQLAYIKNNFRGPIILIHGFQGYPTRTEDSNLRRLAYLKQRYQLEVGFADHEDADNEMAVDLPVYAYLLGAGIIEKHITIHRSSKGTDYYSALEPHEFRVMVEKLRRAEVVFGSLEIKESERKYLEDSSLKIVSRKGINPGEIITDEKIIYKRSSVPDAFMAQKASELFPLIAKSVIPADTPITREMVKKPKVCIAVICRLKSTRLRQKALLPINGVPSIERCLINCLAVPNCHQVILATSDLPEDQPLTAFTLDNKVKIVTGDPINVAKRMLRAAEETNADIVVRVTGDDPFVSPEILAFLIDHHLKSGADFTYAKESTMGTVGDVITVEALRRLLQLLQHSENLIYTEYLSFYFFNNPTLFNVDSIVIPNKWVFPDWRLTLDEPKDLELFEKIYKDLDVGKRPLYFEELKSFLLNHPELIEINKGIKVKWLDDISLINELNQATRLYNPESL
ncbi:N-acetylneuraminate synthase family protein [Paenibacillus sp. S150]|uniref:N-acetylneuraminate synthase family protein n=1 Tax=Paenibacillus sp. S150 TaxID=2749826 RepID=UPI001C565CF3|nr:N-acetylneuraminate synthase family protein [Paenibacillus sp. S150]MBW4080590.1 N-acetylneuraminate synthase family protein [Paenibacillus sp. S150]